MFLKNNFEDNVRLLYLHDWECRLCGGNGEQKGGLSIHHICGRVSRSPFNSAMLCGHCHAHMGHSREEEQKLFDITFRWLHRIGYKPNEYDFMFMEFNSYLLQPELITWLKTPRH